MRISLATEYGIRGITYLAMVDRNRPVAIDEICEAQQIPKNYLIKIFKSLSNARLLRSHKGYRGGFSLARPAEEIAMSEVLRALAGSFRLESDESCLFGSPRCVACGPTCCRQLVDHARQQLDATLGAVTLRDAANQRVPPEKRTRTHRK